MGPRAGPVPGIDGGDHVVPGAGDGRWDYGPGMGGIVMMINPIVGNSEGTIGICTTGPDRSESTRIAGYFDKVLLKEAIDKYFDLFPNRDFEIRFLEMPESKKFLLPFDLPVGFKRGRYMHCREIGA